MSMAVTMMDGSEDAEALTRTGEKGAPREADPL